MHAYSQRRPVAVENLNFETYHLAIYDMDVLRESRRLSALARRRERELRAGESEEAREGRLERW